MTHERTRPSTARGKIIIHLQQTVLREDRLHGSLRFFWLVAQPVFEHVHAVTVMRVWVLISETFSALSMAVYPPSGINEILPRVIVFSNDHSFLLSFLLSRQC